MHHLVAYSKYCLLAVFLFFCCVCVWGGGGSVEYIYFISERRSYLRGLIRVLTVFYMSFCSFFQTLALLD